MWGGYLNQCSYIYFRSPVKLGDKDIAPKSMASYRLWGTSSFRLRKTFQINKTIDESLKRNLPSTNLQIQATNHHCVAIILHLKHFLKYLHEQKLRLWYHRYDICLRRHEPWGTVKGRYIFQPSPEPKIKRKKGN